MDSALVDTGPLIALVSARDHHHARCVQQLRLLRPPLLTTWAVLTEASWLVREDSRAQQSLFAAGAEGLYQVANLDGAALPWLAQFLRRYRSIKAQLADASLVYLAERDGIDTIFTLNRRDFSVFRFGRDRAFKILPEA